MVPSVSDVPSDIPIADPSGKLAVLNSFDNWSGVTSWILPDLFVTTLLTGTRSLSFFLETSPYTFPSGAVLPEALYLGIKSPGSVSSGSPFTLYTKLFSRNVICRVKSPPRGQS